jgi:hypothetical protein
MKPFTTTLVATAFLAATYIAAPATARADGAVDQAPPFYSKSSAARMVDLQVDAARRVASKGGSVRGEVDKLDGALSDENQAWADFANPCHIQSLLEAEIADLHARADAFRAKEADFLVLQFEIVMGRFERAVAQIEAKWKIGEVADDIFEKTVYELRVQAFDYLQSIGTTDIRAMLQEALTVLIERGMQAEDRALALQQVQVKTYMVRLEAALAVLQERVNKGVATKQDYLRIAEYVAALERLQKMQTPFPCGS